jgi:hypothetical protein
MNPRCTAAHESECPAFVQHSTADPEVSEQPQSRDFEGNPTAAGIDSPRAHRDRYLQFVSPRPHPIRVTYVEAALLQTCQIAIIRVLQIAIIRVLCRPTSTSI